MRTLTAALLAALAAGFAPEASGAQTASESGAGQPINAPAWIRVTGVAADDVLNARAEPDASSGIVGSFAPDQGPIEIVDVHDIDGQRWGLVSTGEQGGWINLHYAAPVELATIQGSPVPVGTVCAGTEPFWSLQLGQDAAVWSSFDTEGETYDITESESAASRPWPWMFAMQGFGLALVAPEQCSDGMSDIPYAWSVLVVGHEAGGHVLYEGCCRLRTDR